MAAYDVADVGELEAEGPGGMVRKVRRALDAKAFGFNYFIFPPNQEGREHDHGDGNMEEVYFVVKGSGTMRIDGQEVELQPGRFVRVDPAARCVVRLDLADPGHQPPRQVARGLGRREVRLSPAVRGQDGDGDAGRAVPGSARAEDLLRLGGDRRRVDRRGVCRLAVHGRRSAGGGRLDGTE